MDHAVYIRGLLSVLVGLSLSTLLQSLHRLFRVADRVRWSWLPLAWTGISILMVVQSWFERRYVWASQRRGWRFGVLRGFGASAR